MNRHSALTAVIIALLGMSAIVYATSGLRAFNSESIRQLDARELRPTPDWGHIAPHLNAGQDVTIVTFMYAQCKSICSIASAQFQRLGSAIRSRGLQGKVRLLSISFDPDRDTPEALEKHAENLNVDPAIWQFVALQGRGQEMKLLKEMGVVVIPLPSGEFEHNAAFYVVNQSRQWVDMTRIDEPELALQAALKWVDS